MLSSSSRRCSLRSLAASVPTRHCLRAASRAAQILIASGSPAQATSTSAVASGSAAARSGPTTRENRASASLSSSTLRSTNRVLTRSGVRFLVVTQDGARRAAGQQLADLGRVPGVVEQDEHPAAGQPGPVERCPLVVVGRDLVPFQAEIAQEPGQHLARLGRLGARPEQVNVELAIGELRADLVGGVHRERGLAQPACAVHHRDRHRAGIAGRVRAEQQRAQLLDRRLAAGEVPDVGRELTGARNDRPRPAEQDPARPAGPGRRPRADPSRRWCRSRSSRRIGPRRGRRRRPRQCRHRGVRAGRGGLAERAAASGGVVARPASAPLVPEPAPSAGPGPRGTAVGRRARPVDVGDRGRGRRRRVRRQQLRVQPLELASGLDAELLGDRPARQRVRLKRLRPPSGLVERPHQQRPQPLPHRVVPDQAAQLRHHLGRPAAGEVRLDAQLGRVEPELGRPLGGGDERRRHRDIGQQRPAPQPERLAEQLGRAVLAPGRQLRPALADERLEHLNVNVVRRHPQQVAGRPADEDPSLGVADDLLAQPVHVDADHVVGRARRAFAPQLEDQALGRHELAGPHQQAGQQQPPLGGADRRPAVWALHLEVPQDAKAHQAGPSERTLSSASG